MAERSLNSRMQQKVDTTANWEKATNFIPKKGEIIIYSDAGGAGTPKMKIGDGSTAVSSLPFIVSDAVSAPKLTTARKITLGEAVKSTTTDFDGSKDITIPITGLDSSALYWGYIDSKGSVDPFAASFSYLHNPNRLQFIKPAGVTVEYSNDGGTTWINYGATDEQKVAFCSGIDTPFVLGKVSSGAATPNDMLRITIDATKGEIYTVSKIQLVKYSEEGASGSKMKVEAAMLAAPDTFQTKWTALDIGGWPGWNSYTIQSTFGGYNSSSNTPKAFRYTFSITSAESSTTAPRVFQMMLFGPDDWQTPSNMARTGHLYNWDANQNAVFPGKLTATNLAGALANSFNFNGKTFDNTVPVNFGTIGIAYGGTGASNRKDALTALLGQAVTTNLNEALEQGKYQWGDDASNYPTGEQYGTLLNLAHYGSNNESWNYFTQIAIGTHGTIHWRDKINAQDFSEWRKILDSANYTDYAATKNHNHDGVYLKSVPIASSSILGGVKIGSGITVAEDGTISVGAQSINCDLTIGNKTHTFDGTTDLVFSLADIGAASTSSLNNYMPLSGGVFTGGVQFSAKTNPLSWTIGDTSETTLSIMPNNKTATQSYSLTLPQKTGELATCSKSATLLVEANTWSDSGQATLTLPESYDGLSHTVVISPNPNVITDADTYAAYAAAQIVPSFSSGTSLVLRAYGTVPTVNIQIIITQID